MSNEVEASPNDCSMLQDEQWTNTRSDVVFEEVAAVLNPWYLNQLCEVPEQLMVKLNTEIGIEVERVENSDGSIQFRLRGALDQIILSKMKLEKMMVDKQMQMTFGRQTKSPFIITNIHSLTQHNAFNNNNEEEDNVNSRSRRKVFKPRKVAHNKQAGDEDMQLLQQQLINYHANQLDVSETNKAEDCKRADESVDDEEVTLPLLLTLEEEAERKAAEWLSVPISIDDVRSNENASSSTKVKTGSLYSCELCMFQAEREGQFLKHVLTHSKKDTVHQCNKCSFASVSLNHLNRHLLTHSDATFACPQCDYTTDDPKLLSRHVTHVHTLMENPLKASRLLQCNDCPYNTTKIYHFERHLLVHNRDLKGLLQVHQCEQCPYKTHRKEHMLRHRHNVHTRHRPYSCRSCHRTYKKLEGLQQHERQSH